MKDYNIAGYDNTVWVLEGELLEGGTVEKCVACQFEKNIGGIAAEVLHTCHNKKEEVHSAYEVKTIGKMRCSNCGITWYIDQLPPSEYCFNRETPEVHNCVCWEMGVKGIACDCYCHRETPKEYEGCKTNCYHVKETTKVRLCTCACHE